MEIEIFADKIFYFKNILKNPEESINMIDTMDGILSKDDVFNKSIIWKASSPLPNGEDLNYGIKYESRRNRLLSSSEIIKNFYNTIDECYRFAGQYYFEKLDMEFKEEYYTDFALFRYDTNKEMGPHVDYDGEDWLAPVATGIIYLNDNKSGGDLYFKEQDVLIKPTPGSMVIFPCIKPFYHQSTKILSGKKYLIQCGWKRMV